MKNFLIISILFIFGFSLYTFTLKGVSGNIEGKMIKDKLDLATMPLELSPERGRFILTMSLVENHSFSLSKELADAASPDVGYYKGKLYVYFPPGISFLAVPFYMIGKLFNLSQVVSFASISLFSVFNLILIYLISHKIFRMSSWLSLFNSLVFGFATSSWSYAITLYQHHITLFLILSSFMATWLYSKQTKYKWFYVLYIWLVYGLGIWVDYPNIVLLLPVMIYFFISSLSYKKKNNNFIVRWDRYFIMSSVVFIFIVGLHGYYNYIHFGSWSKVSSSLISIKVAQNIKLTKTNNSEEQISKVANQKSVANFFKEDQLPKSFSILLFSRDRGLFLYAPIFILALFGIYKMRNKFNLELATLLGCIGINLFLYSSWGDPWGGWAFGPRYLIPSMAILSIFIGIWLNNVKYKLISKIVTFIFFLYSSAVALLGALTTNQVPPKVEADYLHMKYNFLLNLDYFNDGRSSSFIFNQYASKFMTLQQYFLLIWGVLIVVVFILLFILPRFEKK